MMRCSVINCRSTTADKVSFFKVSNVPNYDAIKDKLVHVTCQKICHLHFDFQWLRIRLKKGAVPTYFGEIKNKNNNFGQSDAVQCSTDHDHLYSIGDARKKLVETTQKLKVAKAKIRNAQTRSRRARQNVASLQVKLGERVEGEEAKKKYQCNKCEFSTNWPSSLKKHHKVKQHQGVKYTCDECEYSTTNKRQLKIHKNTKHDGVDTSNLTKQKETQPEGISEVENLAVKPMHSIHHLAIKDGEADIKEEVVWFVKGEVDEEVEVNEDEGSQEACEIKMEGDPLEPENGTAFLLLDCIKESSPRNFVTDVDPSDNFDPSDKTSIYIYPKN